MIRCLCAGERRAKTWVVSSGFGEFVVGHRLDLAAEENVVGVQADLPADLAGHEVVVAGQDFDGDAVFAGARSIALAALSFGGSRKAT